MVLEMPCNAFFDWKGWPKKRSWNLFLFQKKISLRFLQLYVNLKIWKSIQYEKIKWFNGGFIRFFEAEDYEKNRVNSKNARESINSWKKE